MRGVDIDAVHGGKMTDQEIIQAGLNYTEAEASRAFEWLRAHALDEDKKHNPRYAAVMLCEIAKLKERERYVQGGAWIPVGEHMPPIEDVFDFASYSPYVLVYRPGYKNKVESVQAAFSPQGEFINWVGTDKSEVSHWMPIPAPSISLGEG